PCRSPACRLCSPLSSRAGPGCSSAISRRPGRPTSSPRRHCTMNEPRRATRLVVFGTCWLLISACAFGQEQQPLTLKQAVALALQNSSQLALARSQYAVAERQQAQANAPFRPNLFTGSGAAYTSGFPMTPSGAAPALFNLSYIQTVLNPPLRG